MPTYEITTPEGHTFDVDAPEGASQEQVMAYARANAPKLLQQKAASQYAGGQDVGQMPALERFAGGAKHAWDRAAYGLKGLVSELTPEERALLQQGSAFAEQGGTAASAGNIAGDVAITLPIGGAATQGLRLATQGLGRGLGAAARTVGELSAGAGIGALVNPEDRARGAATGAIGQGAGMVLNRTLGGLVRPVVTRDAQQLMDAGIQPTVGQSTGGWINALEQKAASVPLLGDAIKHARQRGVNEFNERVIQTAAPGIRGHGDEAVLAARDAISGQYQSALARMPAQMSIEATPIIQAAVDAVDDPALALSQASQARVLDYVERNLLQRQQQITPEVAKRIESDLSAAVQRFITSADAEERAMGQALQQVQQQWRGSLTAIGDMYGAGAGQALREADAAYRAFLPIDLAASRAGAQGVEGAAGTFTPKALRRAIEAVDKSKHNRATRAQAGNTRFDAINRATRSAENVLSDRVPDSGTAGRVLTATLAGGAALGGLPGIAAGAGVLGAGALGSTRAGQMMLTQGARPAIEALVARGVPLQAAADIVERWGPDIAMSLGRSAATQN